jgi:hypothetical protein
MSEREEGARKGGGCQKGRRVLEKGGGCQKERRVPRDDSGQTHSADTLHPQTLSAIESEMT